jgi:uncharacterized SAM-binding protein YcdF (DUF218 family)
MVLLLLSYSGREVYVYATVSSGASADAAIVLGAAIWRDRPSPVFAERINHAINLYRQGRVQALVFTGGKGMGDQLAESEVAVAYALRRGVADQDIYTETESHITYGNLQEAREIMAREGLGSALVVSDPLHMRRAMAIADDLGLEAYPSPTPTTRYRTWRTKSGFLLREARLYTSYLLRRPFMDHAMR